MRIDPETGHLLICSMSSRPGSPRNCPVCKRHVRPLIMTTEEERSTARGDEIELQKCERCGRTHADGFWAVPIGGPICDLCSEDTECP